MSKNHEDLELNKIAASIFLAGLIAMGASKLVHNIYTPKTPEKQGYAVEVPEKGSATVAKVEEVIDIDALLASANIENGAKLFKAKCTSCHTIEQGGASITGPNLWNIYNNDVAANTEYNYSSALSKFEGNWDDKNLYAWLKKPKKFIKGNKMSFIGVRKPAQIADLIAYLKSKK